MGLFITAAIIGLVLGVLVGTALKDQLNQQEDEFLHEIHDDGR